MKDFFPKALLELGYAVRDQIYLSIHEGGDLSSVVAEEGGDTIYRSDRNVEPIILETIEGWTDAVKPLQLIMEGLGDDGRLLVGPESETPQYCLIIDPIDGTRNIMYDKRSAWFIAAVAPYSEEPKLSDLFASVMVELPTSKQKYCDAFASTVTSKTLGHRKSIDGTEEFPLRVSPSGETNLKDGFGQVSNFFPGTKVLASELMEHIAEKSLGSRKVGFSDIFDDQYISTGGQMVELMVGHDRFCCDLRPLFYSIIEKSGGETIRGVECHPYDVAGFLLAQQAGVVITDGFGRNLDAPLDVHTGIHWCGFANQTLADQLAPIIQEWLRRKGL